MPGNSRAESLRRVVELTGLGIAATYFLDPNHGADRRRAALGWIAGARSGRAAHEPLPVAAVAAAPVEVEQEPIPDEPPEPAEELVLLSSVQLAGAAAPRRDVEWPTWGWALVVTITICAIAAFAAVGLGIWAIKHRTTTTTTTSAPAPVPQATGAAAVLADPVAARIIGTASQGHVLLRVDPVGAALAVDGLPALAGGARYRVWVTTGTTTRAAGEFTGRQAVLALKPLRPGSRVTITRERASAPAAAPHGAQVAAVSVRP